MPTLTSVLRPQDFEIGPGVPVTTQDLVEVTLEVEASSDVTATWALVAPSTMNAAALQEWIMGDDADGVTHSAVGAVAGVPADPTLMTATARKVRLPCWPNDSVVIVSATVAAGETGTMTGTAKFATASGSQTTTTTTPTLTPNGGIDWGRAGSMRFKGLANSGVATNVWRTSGSNHWIGKFGPSIDGALVSAELPITFANGAPGNPFPTDELSTWVALVSPHSSDITVPTTRSFSPALSGPTLDGLYEGAGGEPHATKFAVANNSGTAFTITMTPLVPIRLSTSLNRVLIIGCEQTTGDNYRFRATRTGDFVWTYFPATWTDVTLTKPIGTLFAYGVQTGTPTGPSAAYGVY